MVYGFLISLERLRIHLCSLNALDVEHTNNKIILQCIFIVDLEGLSIHSFVCKRSITARIVFSFVTGR